VLGAIALLHLGLGLVLTRSARGDIAALEERWPPEALSTAEDPGPAPGTTGPEYSAWSGAQRRYEDAQRHRERGEQVRLLTIGLSLSWLAQSALVAWIALRRAPGRRGT
jgi:hypothetical protein